MLESLLALSPEILLGGSGIFHRRVVATGSVCRSGSRSSVSVDGVYLGRVVSHGLKLLLGVFKVLANLNGFVKRKVSAYVDELFPYLGGCYAKHYVVSDHLVHICVGAIFAQKFKLGDKLVEIRVALNFVVKLITGEHRV